TSTAVSLSLLYSISGFGEFAGCGHLTRFFQASLCVSREFHRVSRILALPVSLDLCKGILCFLSVGCGTVTRLGINIFSQASHGGRGIFHPGLILIVLREKRRAHTHQQNS